MGTAVGIAITFMMVVFNFILYFLFGLLLTGHGNKTARGVQPGMTVLVGFFLYYSLFTLFAVPVTYRWRPLSLLSQLWGIAVLVIVLLVLVLRFKIITDVFKEGAGYIARNKAFIIATVVILSAQLIAVLYSYQFTLDAAYYVANVTTSVQTNSLNIYDPYTGDWQDHFEMRYFFATYPIQDAVMCYIFKIPALVQTKLIMTSVSILLTNMVYILTGRELGLKKKGICLMLLFAGVINFCFITIYTSSNFLLTRTYEGKSLLGNVVLPAILYFYIKILKKYRGEKTESPLYLYMWIVCFGATVISNSSNMLVPAAVFVLFVPLIVMQLKRKEFKGAIGTALKVFLCVLPCLLLVLIYVAYVKGMFVFYTYPR